MDEINRLRRNQLAIFGCGRNAGDPKRIQRQKFIVSERIKENRAAKARVDTVTDIGLEKLSELGLVWPALVPVPHELLRVSECFGDRTAGTMAAAATAMIAIAAAAWPGEFQRNRIWKFLICLLRARARVASKVAWTCRFRFPACTFSLKRRQMRLPCGRSKDRRSRRGPVPRPARSAACIQWQAPTASASTPPQ